MVDTVLYCVVLYCTALYCTGGGGHGRAAGEGQGQLYPPAGPVGGPGGTWTSPWTQPEQSPVIISRLRLTAWASSASQRTMSSCGPCSTAAASNISHRSPICRTLFAPVADTPPSWTCLGGGGTRPSPRTRWWPPSRCPSPSPPPPSCSPSSSSPAGTASSSNSAERTSSAGRRLSSSTNRIYCCLLHINCLQL